MNACMFYIIIKIYIFYFINICTLKKADTGIGLLDILQIWSIMVLFSLSKTRMVNIGTDKVNDSRMREVERRNITP